MEATSTIDQELLDSLKGITPTPIPSPTPTPTPSTSTYKYVPKTTTHTCQAFGCTREEHIRLRELVVKQNIIAQITI